MSRETWILNGLIVTQDARRRVLRANLRIEDGKISAITSARPKRRASKTQIINAEGLAIFPGFVQAHVHLCQTLFRNQADDLELLDWLSKRIWKMEALHTEETLYASAALGIHELLGSGTTCILDMATVRHTESVLEAVRDLGIRASVGKCLMDHSENPPYLREPTHVALDEARELFYDWNGAENGRIRVSYAPRFAISCTDKMLRAVAELAVEQKALIHTHASENRGEVAIVKKRTGRDNVEYLHRVGLTKANLVLAHCIWLKPREMAILKKTRTAVTHCPSSNLKLASGIAPVPELRRRGVTVALGGDGAPCNNNLNMFQEMRLAALIQKPIHGPTVMKAREVLDMATREGAKALNWFAEIGSLEVGKRADLFAMDLHAPEISGDTHAIERGDLDAISSSVVYAGQPQHVKLTMVDGSVVFKNGRLSALSREKLLAITRQAREKIAKRLPYLK